MRLIFCLVFVAFLLPEVFSSSGFGSNFKSGTGHICNENCNNNACINHRKYWHTLCDQGSKKHAISLGDTGCYGCYSCLPGYQPANTNAVSCRDFGKADWDDVYCCYECRDGGFSYGTGDYKSYGKDGYCYYSTTRYCTDYQRYTRTNPGARRVHFRPRKSNSGAGVSYPGRSEWDVKPSGGADNYCTNCDEGQERNGGTNALTCKSCATGYFRRYATTPNNCVKIITCESYGAGYSTAVRFDHKTLPDVCECAVGYYFTESAKSSAIQYGLQYSFDNDRFLWYSTRMVYGEPAVNDANQGCVRCPAGKTTPTAGKQTCVDVASVWNGDYYDYATNAQVECPAGTFQPVASFTSDADATAFYNKGIAVCTECPAGSSANPGGQTDCTPCLPGQYQNETGQTSCRNATRGKYASGVNNIIDTDCPVGTYSDEEGLAQCKDTVPGEYQDQEGETAPKQCASGTYSSINKAVRCLSHSDCAWSQGNGIYDLDVTTYQAAETDISLSDYALQYNSWVSLTVASISKLDDGSPTHDTICRCNPGFYFSAGRSVESLFTTTFADHAAYVEYLKTQPQQPRVPCWPVTPGYYTDTYNAIQQIPYKTCSESDSLKLYGNPVTYEQRKCQCKAGYYRDGGGTGITYNGDSISFCTAATAGTNYVPTDGCDGSGCLKTAHTCNADSSGIGLKLRTAATTTADVKCRCNVGYYRPQGGDYLAYNVDCTPVNVSNNEFIDQAGQSIVKISLPCETYTYSNGVNIDGNGHVEYMALTFKQNRRCQCAVGFFRETSAINLISPYTKAGVIYYNSLWGECRRPGETNGIKNGFVDQVAQTASTPYTTCSSPSTTNSADALSYYHDRKCQCQKGYYRANGHSFSAGVNCTDSGVGFIVPVVGSSTRIACGTNTTVAAGNKPGYCPYSVNSVAILYPTCYHSTNRPTVAHLDSTRTTSSPGQCRCGQGYYRPGNGDAFDYFKTDGGFLDTLPECTAASRGHKVPDAGAKSQIECTDEVDYQPETGKTTCITLPACHDSTVNDTPNTNTIHGRRCKCNIGYYDTADNGGTNLVHTYTCQRPCFDTEGTCREYLPPNLLGANANNLLPTTPCHEGTNLVLQKDRTFTSGYLCACDGQHHRKLLFDALDFSDILAFQNSFSHLTYVMSCAINGNTAEFFDFKYYNSIRYLDLRCGDTSLNSGSVRLEIDMPVSFPVGWTGSFHAVGLSSSPATTQFQNDGTVNNGIELWSSPAGQNIYTLVDAKLSGVGLTGTRPFDYTITVNDALAIQTDFKVKFKSYSVGYSTNVRLQSLDVEPRPLEAGVDTCEPWASCPSGSLTETQPSGTSQRVCECDHTKSYNTLNGDKFESPGAELVFYLPFDSNFLDSGPEAKAPVYESNVEISSAYAKVGSGALYSSSRTLDSFLNYQALPPINILKEGMASCWWMQMFYDDPDAVSNPIIHFRDTQNHVGKAKDIRFYYDPQGPGYDQVQWVNYNSETSFSEYGTYGGFGVRSNDAKNYHYCFNLYTSDAGFYAFETFRNGLKVSDKETTIRPLGIVSWDVAFFDYTHSSSTPPVEIVIDDFRVYRGQLSPENVFDLSRKIPIKHCRTKDSCQSIKAVQFQIGDSKTNRRCQCSADYFDTDTGAEFEAPGTDICEIKGTCSLSTVTHVKGGTTVDQTCQCKTGYYRLGGNLNLEPGTSCYEQNTCDENSTTVQTATVTSDAECKCKDGYFREAGDTFYITSCPQVCQEQSCTLLGECASPSTIQYGDLIGTEDRKCQCAPGYYNSNGGTDLLPGTTCSIALVDEGEYVPDAGSNSPTIMNPCPDPSTEVDWPGSITMERRCRCRPGFYRPNDAFYLHTSITCSAVDEGYFTASHSATEQEPHRACPASTIEFEPPTSTSQRRCRCDRGYYKSTGATDLSVDENCTAATPGYFVSEIGSTSQEPWHECGSTLAVQSNGTSVSDVVCECAPQHYATQWENLAWDDSCTARSVCEGSLTYMMTGGVFVEPPGDSDSVCMCRDGFYLTDPFNLPPTATCFESGDCNNTLQMYQLGDIENPTLCKCALGYYVDLVMHHRKHALMELSFESGTSVQDSLLGHVFTLGSLIDLPSPTPASFTPGRVGQYSLDFSGNEIYYYSQNYNFYREGIDGLTLSFHVNLNSATRMQLAMDLSAFRVVMLPDSGIFFHIEMSGGYFSVGMPGRTLEPNEWHHIAVVFDYTQNRIRGYLNGTYLGFRDFPLNDAFLNSGPISIGGFYGSDAYKSLDGKLDDVRFSSDVLTESEIGILANYKQKDVFLDIPTDKSWFSGLPTTSECTLLSTCHSSAMSMWPDPANPSDFDTFGDTLCTCKPGFYRPVFASNFDSLTECTEAPSGYFVASKNQTSYEEWGECGVGAEELTAGTTTTRPTCQCVAGYYRPEGGYNFGVNLDCTAASHLYYVPEKGSSTQLVCPDGTNNVGTANTECGPCLLFDHFGYCWEPYTTILQTTDGVIRADEVTVSFDGLLRSGPQIQPFCDFIDYHGDFYECLQFPNCPKQGTCNIETLNLSSDLSCDRITSQTRCSDVENTAQTYHPLFLVQTYDLHYCTANPSCSQFRIDPLLCSDCGSFCTTSYLKRKNFTDSSPDYDPTVLSYDEYMFEFTSLDCAELSNHAFLGVGSDFITPGNKFLHYWDVKWRGLSSGSFSTIALAGSNETVDWVRASNPRILLHHFWGDRQVGLEVSIGSILVRLLHNRVQVLKQDVVDTLIWERAISHLDTKTLKNSGLSKVLFETTDVTDGSFCSSSYQDGSCSATWTHLKSLSTFPVQFITSHIRPQDTSPTNTVKISFWDGELYDLPLNLSEFISLATQNSYRDDIQYSLPLKRYTGRSSLISPVLDRRVLPPRSQDTSEYLCKESLLNNPSTTPVGAWLLQYYLMTDNIFTNFTRSYSDEIYRSLSGLVLDASNGLVTMSSNVYPDSIVALSQSLQCGDSEKSTLSGLYSDLQDVYTATGVSINSRLMSEGSFYLNTTLDAPDYYLRYRNIVNEQLNLLESTAEFLVSRVFSVYPKTNYSYPTGEFFIWRDVSLLYPAFDLGAGARPGTLGTKHHFRSFTPHYLSIEGSNIKQAFLYYRQAVCSTGLRADCISDPTKWLTPEEQSKKGWEMWYHIFDDGSLDTLKIPLPLLPTDVYEVSLQVASVKTFRPNQQLYSNVQRFLTGEHYAQTQDTYRYQHSKLWNRLSIQKDILPASDFEVGVFNSNLDLDAKFLPSDSFARFETGEAASNSGFTFCMTYYPLTSQEPSFRIQNRLMNVRSGLPVKLQDGTESVLGYHAGAWDVVAQRARGDAFQKLTCICYLSSGEVFLNGLSISDPSVVAPARVFLGDHLDIGTATYEPELALGPQGILLYTVGFWPSALDHDSIMKIQTDELRKHSATVVKSPLIDSFYAERHVRISAIAETDASMPFYYRNFIHDVFFSHIDLALNPADFDHKLITENCEANGYECTFLYTRFDTSIPPLCVDGVDSSIYRPREMYGTCSSQDGILTSGGLTFISNNENTGIYRIYDGFYGPNYGLLLIANLVVNINAEFQPDFNSEIIFSNTMDFSLSRFDRETLAVRACGQHMSFKIPATGSAFKVEVKVSLNAGGDILIFWWDGKPIESFYFTRKHENNSRFVSYEKCIPSSGRFQMFRTQKRTNIGISSFYAMSPYPTKSVGGIEMVDRHLQSFHISGPDCRKKCVVYNQDPNTVTVDGEVVADIGEKKIRLLSKTHKNWALVSDSYFGFVVRADLSFNATEVNNVDFLEMEITLPFAHLVEVEGSTLLETIFLTVSGAYETSPSFQVELRGGIPPFDQFRTREIYSERRTFLGVANQRNLQVEVKMRGNTFMLYLDGEEKYTMSIGKRFPLSEFVIVSRKPYKFEDGLYEYSDFIILTKAHENCECRSNCAVATFASDGECLSCPENTLTFTSGATSINECVCKPLYRKNEFGLCEPITHLSTLNKTAGYCTASSCALRRFMVSGQSGCSCTDDCFVQTLQPDALPCCPNKCTTCPSSKDSAEGEFFSRNCECEYDASQGVAVNRAGTTGCTGFVCGPGWEPLDGRCSACVENFYKVGVNLEMCVACEPCPQGFFRDGCQNSSSGVCLPCSTCGTGETVLEQCGQFSDTLCFDSACDTTPPTSHLLGPFGLLMISSQAGCIISPENHILECWGDSQYWDGSYQQESRLSIPMHSYMQPVDVQMGDDFICLLSLSGFVQCAGSNADGQLGMGSDVISEKLTDLENSTPIDFGNNIFIVSMAVGSSHTCVLSDIGTVLCFGLNHRIQLGRPVGSDIQTPVDVGSAQIVLQVACGSDYSCVRLQSGGVKCFGNWQNPGSGSLNRQFFLGDNLPELDLGTTSFAVDVQASGSHTCVHFEDKTVKCFGQSGEYLAFDTSGETSFGLSPQTMGANLPTLFGEQTPILQMALTPDSSCFLTVKNRVICAGSSLFTGYYSGTPPHNNILTGRIQDTWYLDFEGDTILEIFAFEQGEKNCAYSSSGKVYCWTLLLPSVILQLDLPTELCAEGDYSTQCRTNDVYQLLFSRGFLSRRSPLGRKTAEEYGILTSCRQCTTTVEECAEGEYLSDKCDSTQPSFKDNSCLPCSLFQCKNPGKFLTDEDCGVLAQNSTRFAASIECTGVCSQQEDSYLERGCNVL